MIGRGITRAALGSGLSLWAPLAFAHEAAFHFPPSLAGAVNYVSGVEYTKPIHVFGFQ